MRDDERHINSSSSSSSQLGALRLDGVSGAEEEFGDVGVSFGVAEEDVVDFSESGSDARRRQRADELEENLAIQKKSLEFTLRLRNG